MALSVNSGQWQVTRGKSDVDGPRPSEELSRTYNYAGLPPPDRTASIRIVCTLESEGLIGGLEAEKGELQVFRRLRFFFEPFRLPHDAQFVMGLFTTDRSEGGEFDVLASPMDRDTSLFAKFGGRYDVRTCLDTILSGKDMIFTLADQTGRLVSLPLPNDSEFQRLCEEARKRLVQTEVAYELIRSNSISQSGYSPPTSQGGFFGKLKRLFD